MFEPLRAFGEWLSEPIVTTQAWWIMWVAIAYVLGFMTERAITRFYAYVDRRQLESMKLYSRLAYYTGPRTYQEIRIPRRIEPPK